MNKALIIIDVQNDYFDNGSMTLVGMDAAAANCARLLAGFRARGAPIFHIQHLAAQEGATFFVPGTPGSEIHEIVTPDANETLVTKHFPNAFRGTELDSLLREAGISELVICGAMSHMCIDTSVRAAFDLGYRCELAADACATRDLEFDGKTVVAAEVHAAFMAALSSPFSAVMSTEDILDGIVDA